MDLIWTQLTKIKRVKCQDFEKLWKNFLQEPNFSFKKVAPSNKRLGERYLANTLPKEQEKKGWGDEMGRERTLDINHTRQKYVHQQGVVTRAKFIPTQTDKGYTGIFESGAQNVIIRFSDALQHLEGSTNRQSPSIALKFLRSGVTSGNQFGMVSFEGTANGEWDFWAKDLKSHLPTFQNSEEEIEQSMCISEGEWFFNHSEVHKTECAPLTMGNWMSMVDERHGMIYQNGNIDLASFAEDGTPVANKQPIAPFDIIFVPNRSVLGSTNSSSRFYKQLVANSQSIKENDVLFTVKARAFDPETGKLTGYEEIGKVKQAAPGWTESLWGDERLFFSHNILHNDWRDIKAQVKRTPLATRQEKRARNREMKKVWNELNRFDFEKYEFDLFNEEDPEAEFEPEEVGERQIIDGMVTNGCPFGFLIDQVNNFIHA